MAIVVFMDGLRQRFTTGGKSTQAQLAVTHTRARLSNFCGFLDAAVVSICGRRSVQTQSRGALFLATSNFRVALLIQGGHLHPFIRPSTIKGVCCACSLPSIVLLNTSKYIIPHEGRSLLGFRDRSDTLLILGAGV